MIPFFPEIGRNFREKNFILLFFREERKKRKEEEKQRKEEEKLRKEEEKRKREEDRKLAEMKRRQKELEAAEAAAKAEAAALNAANGLPGGHFGVGGQHGEVFDSMQVNIDDDDGLNLADVEDLGHDGRDSFEDLDDLDDLDDDYDEDDVTDEDDEDDEDDDDDVDDMEGYEMPIGPLPQLVTNDLKSLDEMVSQFLVFLQCYQLSYCVHENSKSVTLDSINSKVFTVSKDILEVILLFSVFGILSWRL